MKHKRTVFFISDRTGITAEMLGRSLLTQFADIQFSKITLPFIDTPDKARSAKEKIDRSANSDGTKPLVFSTLVTPETRAIIASSNALYLDLFENFLDTLESELNMESSPVVGHSHGIRSEHIYDRRIEAINFTLSHDDGATSTNLGLADIILVGVSRTGKTPVSLYLALQHGIRAANYPLTPDDFKYSALPPALRQQHGKLFGLTISPERLQKIRQERMPDSVYASLATCRQEVTQAEALFRLHGIHFVDTTSRSIEEISATIMHDAGFPRPRH